MPATTPNRNYPYPVDADTIDVTGDIQRLAEAVDLDIVTAVAGAARVNTRLTNLETNDSTITRTHRRRGEHVGPTRTRR